jgi:hypothetical protein
MQEAERLGSKCCKVKVSSMPPLTCGHFVWKATVSIAFPVATSVSSSLFLLFMTLSRVNVAAFLPQGAWELGWGRAKVPRVKLMLPKGHLPPEISL